MAAKPLSQYFSDRSADYARFRPSYAAGAIDAALADLPEPRRVADVGCGTGIASRLIHGRGLRVVGVDPNEAMLEEARQAGCPAGLRYCCAPAEETGLAEASVELVVCAQAYHWFDAPAALRELHRVLVPGGRLALMWNVRDPTRGFGLPHQAVVRRARLWALESGRQLRNARSGDPSLGGLFGEVEERAYPNDAHVTWEQVIGRLSSASYFPREGALRAELVAELQAAFDEHAEGGRVELPQATELTLATRQ